MKKAIKKRFQEMILEIVDRWLPSYSSPYYSDTTFIARELARQHRKELIEMGLLPPNREETHYHHPDVEDGWYIQSAVLRQLNNLHKEGKIKKKLDYGGRGKGRNFTYIRWGPIINSKE